MYYVAPWLLACLALSREAEPRAGARWLRPVPSILAILIGGAAPIMLAVRAFPTGAPPAILERWVPVGVVELSHLAGAVTGLALLLLAARVARGYGRRQRLTVRSCSWPA